MGRMFEKLAESKKVIAALLALVLTAGVCIHERDMSSIKEGLHNIAEDVKELKLDVKEQHIKYDVDLRYEVDKIYAETDGLEERVRKLEIEGN